MSVSLSPPAQSGEPEVALDAGVIDVAVGRSRLVTPACVWRPPRQPWVLELQALGG